jgi:hypothetical protein
MNEFDGAFQGQPRHSGYGGRRRRASIPYVVACSGTTLERSPNAGVGEVVWNNGTFSAAQGWDACTGLGSPNGDKLSTIEMPAPVSAGV